MEQIINLINKTGDVLFVESLGQDMPDGASGDILSGEFTSDELSTALQGDLKTLITAGSIVVNDGTDDLSASDGIDQIKRASKKYIDDKDAELRTAFEQKDTELQAEIDAIETGSGLEDDGSYKARTTSNYLNASGSLKEDSTLLDAELKAVDTKLETLKTTVADDLNKKVNKAGDTMTGDLSMGDNEVTTTTDPKTMNSVARKSQILTMMQGVSPKAHVSCATTDPLPACTYTPVADDNASKLTANANGKLVSIDSHTITATSTILLAGQADKKQNGVYDVTEVGDASKPQVLTRRPDLDGKPENELLPGTTIPVYEGDRQAGYQFYILGKHDVARKVDVDDIEFGYTPNAIGAGNTQAEIDAIESALNLNADGTFKAHSGTNYMDSATTAFSARELLDAEVKKNADEISANSTAIENFGMTVNDIKLIDGTVYGKDTTRNKWLSSRETYIYSRKGMVNSKYLKIGGDILTNASSIRVSKDMCVTGITAHLGANVTGTSDIHIFKNGERISLGKLTITNTNGGHKDDLNIALAEGDIVQVYVSGSTVREPVVKLSVAYAVSL